MFKKIALFTFAFFLFANNSHATLITTSGNATDGDVSISLDVTFEALSGGLISSLEFSSLNSLDSNRDAVRFTGLNQLLIEVNNKAFYTPFMDFNDGFDGLNGRPYIWFNGPTVNVGDLIRISGTATNGAFIFGNSAATYSLVKSGDYTLSLGGIQSQLASNSVPEPSAIFLFALSLIAFTFRSSKKI